MKGGKIFVTKERDGRAYFAKLDEVLGYERNDEITDKGEYEALETRVRENFNQFSRNIRTNIVKTYEKKDKPKELHKTFESTKGTNLKKVGQKLTSKKPLNSKFRSIFADF